MWLYLIVLYAHVVCAAMRRTPQSDRNYGEQQASIEPNLSTQRQLTRNNINGFHSMMQQRGQPGRHHWLDVHSMSEAQRNSYNELDSLETQDQQRNHIRNHADEEYGVRNWMNPSYSTHSNILHRLETQVQREEHDIMNVAKQHRHIQDQRIMKFREWQETHRQDLDKRPLAVSDAECGICQNPTPEDKDDCFTKLKTCKKQHTHCYMCISGWLERSQKKGMRGEKLATCPTCRAEFGYDDIVPEMFGMDSKCDTACGLK
jgi:hypothetical protein